MEEKQAKMYQLLVSTMCLQLSPTTGAFLNKTNCAKHKYGKKMMMKWFSMVFHTC